MSNGQEEPLTPDALRRLQEAGLDMSPPPNLISRVGFWFSFWFAAWLGTTLAGGLLGLLLGGPTGVVLGCIVAGFIALPVHVTCAIVTRCLWLAPFRVLVAALAGAATGALAACSLGLEWVTAAVAVLGGLGGGVAGVLHSASVGRQNRNIEVAPGLAFTLCGLLLRVAVLAAIVPAWVWMFTVCPPSELFVLQSGRNAACHNNLKQIGIALEGYYAKNGHFPPAYVADASDKPLYSWRVLILPYMDMGELLHDYDRTEPWDRPHNRKASEQVIPFYLCPSQRGKIRPITSYLAVTGPNTAWPGPKGSKLEDLKHPPSQTILVVEVADSDVSWAEPRDLDIQDLIHATRGLRPSSRHGRGFNALFADGSVHYLDWERVRALLDPDGSAAVDPKDCKTEPPHGIP